MMLFIDIYAQQNLSKPQVEFLYRLLEQRDPVANISHRRMPTFEEHAAFVESRPYKAWYLLGVTDFLVGAIYLTKADEIGISILKEHQGKGYGSFAIRKLMGIHPCDRFLANIAPGNARSISMFEKLGFDVIQYTFAKEKP